MPQHQGRTKATEATRRPPPRNTARLHQKLVPKETVPNHIGCTGPPGCRNRESSETSGTSNGIRSLGIQTTIEITGEKPWEEGTTETLVRVETTPASKSATDESRNITEACTCRDTINFFFGCQQQQPDQHIFHHRYDTYGFDYNVTKQQSSQ